MLEIFSIPEFDQNSDWQQNLSRNADPKQPEDNLLRKQSAENTRRNIAGLAQYLVNQEGFQRGRFLKRWVAVMGESIGANARPS